MRISYLVITQGVLHRRARSSRGNKPWNSLPKVQVTLTFPSEKKKKNKGRCMAAREQGALSIIQSQAWTRTMHTIGYMLLQKVNPSCWLPSKSIEYLLFVLCYVFHKSTEVCSGAKLLHSNSLTILMQVQRCGYVLIHHFCEHQRIKKPMDVWSTTASPTTSPLSCMPCSAS